MADEQLSRFVYDAQGNKKYGWDGKQWVSLAGGAPGAAPTTKTFAPGAMQTKPGGPILNASEQEHPLRQIPPTILSSFGIDPKQVEAAPSTLAALKAGGGSMANTIGEGMFESLAKAGPLAPAHAVVMGLGNIEQAMKDGSIEAYRSYQGGDRAGLARGLTKVASALGQMALMKQPGEQVGKVVDKTIEGVARAPLGVSKPAERMAAEDVAAANRKATEDFEASKRQVDAQYKRDTQKFEQARGAETITTQGKSARPRVPGEESGATKARLLSQSDRVRSVAEQTQNNIKSAFDQRYNKFREDLGVNPQVSWTPVQQAVKYAEDNILQGSPESITLFRNIMKEGPQLDEASVYKTTATQEAAGNLADIYKGANEATKKRIEAQLASQGLSVDDLTRGTPGEPSRTVTGGLQIPHKDAWGYAQELNAKMNGAQLPSDVYRALRYVKEEAVDKVLQDFADSKNQGGTWKQLQSDYKDYAQRFLDKDTPTYKLLKSTNPDDRLGIITGKEGQNLIDVLHKYRSFGGDPSIAGKIRALKAASGKSVESLPEPVRGEYPKPPELQTFDPNEWRKQRLREYQEKITMRQPQTQWQFMQLPFFRAMSRLYTDPNFVRIILGIK